MKGRSIDLEFSIDDAGTTIPREDFFDSIEEDALFSRGERPNEEEIVFLAVDRKAHGDFPLAFRIHLADITFGVVNLINNSRHDNAGGDDDELGLE